MPGGCTGVAEGVFERHKEIEIKRANCGMWERARQQKMNGSKKKEKRDRERGKKKAGEGGGGGVISACEPEL